MIYTVSVTSLLLYATVTVISFHCVFVSLLHLFVDIFYDIYLVKLYLYLIITSFDV